MMLGRWGGRCVFRRLGTSPHGQSKTVPWVGTWSPLLNDTHTPLPAGTPRAVGDEGRSTYSRWWRSEGRYTRFHTGKMCCGGHTGNESGEQPEDGERNNDGRATDDGAGGDGGGTDVGDEDVKQIQTTDYETVWTIPNMLTMSRIVAAPGLAAMVVYDYHTYAVAGAWWVVGGVGLACGTVRVLRLVSVNAWLLPLLDACS